MTKRKADQMVKRLKARGFEATVYEGYSGRCMFGDKTWAVTTDAHPSEAGSRDLRSDNMGLGFVYY